MGSSQCQLVQSDINVTVWCYLTTWEADCLGCLIASVSPPSGICRRGLTDDVTSTHLLRPNPPQLCIPQHLQANFVVSIASNQWVKGYGTVVSPPALCSQGVGFDAIERPSPTWPRPKPAATPPSSPRCCTSSLYHSSSSPSSVIRTIGPSCETPTSSS